MKASDYFKSRGIEPSKTFFCEYCGLEKQNDEAHLVTVVVCDDCYDADIASLRSQLAAVTEERDRLREAMESIAKMSADQSTDKVRMLAIRDGINVRAIGALFPEAAPESEDK